MSHKILNPSRSRPIRGVLFDMDGLVLDTEVLYTRFWMEAAEEVGRPMTYEQALGMRSLNKVRSQQYLDRILGAGVDYDRLRAIRIRRMDAFIARHGVQAKPGVFELLDYLRLHHIPCAITTSSPLDRVEEYLRPLGLYDRFDRLCSGYEVAHGKPDPDIYLYGAQCLRLDPAACMALEDSPAGIESAFRAGCLPVVIPDQDQPDAETRSRSYARADSLADVITLLEELNHG